MMKRVLKILLQILMDAVITLLLILSIYIGYYKLPQKGVPAVKNPIPMKSQVTIESTGTLQQNITSGLTAEASPVDTGALAVTDKKLDSEDWHQKFASKFTSTVVSTDTSYTSPNLAIYITRGSYDSGRLDYSEGGKHTRYGTNVQYTVADIYVGDITCLQTAFAQDTYGNGYSEKISDMSSRLGAVLAVNGDSYNNNRHKDNGTIIRNGVIYRDQKTDMETCVLNWDGTMQIYTPEQLDTQTLIKNGAYQSWVFGPSLLDENGKAKTDFMTWDYIRESHPRTAIGYYEPGHYCLLVADGREPGYSRGMFLNEEAAIFEQLGCKAAYNLDGGHCSFMTLQSQVVTKPYKAEHPIPDGIFIFD